MLSKLLSGRYLLTVICGMVFFIVSINKIIPVDAIIAILTMVFISYFQRQDRTNGKGETK